MDCTALRAVVFSRPLSGVPGRQPVWALDWDLVEVFLTTVRRTGLQLFCPLSCHLSMHHSRSVLRVYAAML